jgi:hypothetical protein
MLDYEFWNPDLGQGFVIVAAHACRQAGQAGFTNRQK